MALEAGKNAEQLGVRVGDKFKVLVANEFFKVGEVIELVSDDGSKNPWFKKANGGGHHPCYLDRLEPLPHTLETLRRGDFVLDDDGDPRKILADLPGVYLISEHNDHDVADGWYTAVELKRDGYTVPESTEPDKIEIEGQYYTIGEIKEALGKK